MTGRARKSMLRAVYEDNRRIVRDEAVGRSVSRGGRFAGGVGLLVVLAGALVIALASRPDGEGRDRTGERSTAVEQAAQAASPFTILGANLPVVDTADTDDSWVAEEEFQALVEQPTPLAQLFDLRVRTVVLDPGHGGADPGAVGPSGLLEKEVTLDVARRLKRRLEENGYRVHMTREGDETLALRDRVDFANAGETDLFVSIHVNQLPVDTLNVVETYYFGANTDARSLRVAERENVGSDYSVADFNRMIRSVGTTVKLQESRRLARSVQRSMVTNKRDLGLRVDNWGSKSGPFVVLLGSEAPSILAEVAALSHPTVEAQLRSPAHREQIAMFLEEGILTYLISRNRSESGAEPND